MTVFLILFLAIALIKIINNDLAPLYRQSRYEFYVVTGIALIGAALFIMQIAGVKMVSPLQTLSLWFEKIGLTYKK